jgi:hypothetical protein
VREGLALTERNVKKNFFFQSRGPTVNLKTCRDPYYGLDCKTPIYLVTQPLLLGSGPNTQKQSSLTERFFIRIPSARALRPDEATLKNVKNQT